MLRAVAGGVRTAHERRLPRKARVQPRPCAHAATWPRSSGAGAHAIASLLRSRGVQLEMVVDEGGVILMDGLKAGSHQLVSSVSLPPPREPLRGQPAPSRRGLDGCSEDDIGVPNGPARGPHRALPGQLVRR